MQIPSVVKEIQKNDAEKIKYLHQVNYWLSKGKKSIQLPSSALNTWRYTPANDCAISLFQPLLQVLAHQTAKDSKLSETQENSLKSSFEILISGFKYFLVNKFIDSTDAKVLKTALQSSIFNSFENF